MISDSQEQHLGPRSGASGLWCEVFTGNFADPPALFLERDDVIVEDTHYGNPETITSRSRIGDHAHVLRSAKMWSATNRESRAASMTGRVFRLQDALAVKLT
jgi:hypothetical protein